MTRQDTQHTPLWPWVLLVLWVAVIWGHSLMPGDLSSVESSQFIEWAQKAAYVVVQSHHPLVDQFIAAHPNFVYSLASQETMHFYVRKLAHFSEYFVLGILAFNAVRATFRNPVLGLLALTGFWAGTPSIDEFIQLHVPNRAGQLRDVLIDMAGFGTGLVLSLLVFAVFAIIGGLFSLVFGRRSDSYDLSRDY